MSCAVDTNIIIDLVAGDDVASNRATDMLDREGRRGALYICGPVYAECLAHSGWKRADLERFLQTTSIRVDWVIDEPLWRQAGAAFASYAHERRKARTGTPRRLLSDFIVGAHAERVGGLMTRDRGYYSTYFPSLRIISA